MSFEDGYILGWSISSHCRQQTTNRLIVFDHFLELALKGLNIIIALELRSVEQHRSGVIVLTLSR